MDGVMGVHTVPLMVARMGVRCRFTHDAIGVGTLMRMTFLPSVHARHDSHALVMVEAPPRHKLHDMAYDHNRGERIVEHILGAY